MEEQREVNPGAWRTPNAVAGAMRLAGALTQSPAWVARLVARTRPLVIGDFGEQRQERMRIVSNPGRLAAQLAGQFVPNESAPTGVDLALAPAAQPQPAVGAARWHAPASPPVGAIARSADTSPVAMPAQPGFSEAAHSLSASSPAAAFPFVLSSPPSDGDPLAPPPTQVGEGMVAQALPLPQSNPAPHALATQVGGQPLLQRLAARAPRLGRTADAVGAATGTSSAPAASGGLTAGNTLRQPDVQGAGNWLATGLELSLDSGGALATSAQTPRIPGAPTLVARTYATAPTLALARPAPTAVQRAPVAAPEMPPFSLVAAPVDNAQQQAVANLENIAQQVYDHLRRRLLVEHERRGRSY